MDINIALIEPEIPQNTGNIARTCAAVGASLHLVKPLGFEIDDKKLKRAGLDYWHALDITYYESLEDFLCINQKEPMFFYTTKAAHNFTTVTIRSVFFSCLERKQKDFRKSSLQLTRSSVYASPCARTSGVSTSPMRWLWAYLKCLGKEILQDFAKPEH